MTTCYIGIGSNLGDRRRFIYKAIDLVKSTKGVSVNRVSSIYETDPVGYSQQRRFLNGVLQIETSLHPNTLLRELNRIEDILGRRRLIRNGPRTIDLDILYYGDQKIKTGRLSVPHPRIRKRETESLQVFIF